MQGSIDEKKKTCALSLQKFFWAGIAININDACLIIKVLQSRNPRNLSNDAFSENMMYLTGTFPKTKP